MNTERWGISSLPTAAAALPRKKDGEKAELLRACGQMVFRCEGDILTTQGIYCSEFGRKTECFCKRAVWVPRVFNLGDLQSMFSSFGAELNCDVTADTVVGVCGLLPTRTAHASGNTFLVLAQFMKKKFTVIATVKVTAIRSSDDEPPSYDLREISSGGDCVRHVVNWIKEESTTHRTTTVKKRGKYKKHKKTPSDDGSADLDPSSDSLELYETPKKRTRRTPRRGEHDFPKTPEIISGEVHTILGTPSELSSAGPTPELHKPTSDLHSELEIVSVPPVMPYQQQEQSFCWLDGMGGRPVTPTERYGLFCQSPSFYEMPPDTPSSMLNPPDAPWPSTSPFL